MIEPGQIDIEVSWDGSTVRAVSIRSSRPSASRVLVGRTPDQVSPLVGLLFSLCGRAQSLCARLAVDAAMGRSADSGSADLHAVLAERVFEHLWRIWIDWPLALGVAPRRQIFAELAAPLRNASNAGEFRAAAIKASAALRQQNHGHDLRALLVSVDALRDAAFFDGWLATLIQLDRDDAPATLTPLPNMPLRAWLSALPPWDAGFALAPIFRGQPAETGALTDRLDDPGICALLENGSAVAARVVARLAALDQDLSALIDEAMPSEQIDVVRTQDGEAVARVLTARGPLLHRVVIEAERVADYVIVAPTEWNFHPRGALCASLEGRRFADAAALKAWADALVLALDPCVPARVSVRSD